MPMADNDDEGRVKRNLRFFFWFWFAFMYFSFLFYIISFVVWGIERISYSFPPILSFVTICMSFIFLWLLLLLWLFCDWNIWFLVNGIRRSEKMKSGDCRAMPADCLSVYIRICLFLVIVIFVRIVLVIVVLCCACLLSTWYVGSVLASGWGFWRCGCPPLKMDKSHLFRSLIRIQTPNSLTAGISTVGAFELSAPGFHQSGMFIIGASPNPEGVPSHLRKMINFK